MRKIIYLVLVFCLQLVGLPAFCQALPYGSTLLISNQLQSVQKTVIQNKLPVITQTDNYTYDTNGNRLTKTVTGTSITTPQVTQYSYDFLNQLIGVVNPKNQTINYTYDYAGRRISRSLGTSSQSYIYDGNNVMADLNKNGKVLRRYTRNPLSNGGINGLVAIETRIPKITTTTPPPDPIIGDPEDETPDVEEPTEVDPLTLGAFYYYQYDRLGSVTGLSDSTGLLTTQYTYTAFGLTRTSSGVNQGSLYKYSSKAYDGATGLYYYGRRFYDATAGRWLTQDPLGMVNGPNRYAFVRNNPVNRIDPWGLATCTISEKATNTTSSSEPSGRQNGPTPEDYIKIVSPAVTDAMLPIPLVGLGEVAVTAPNAIARQNIETYNYFQGIVDAGLMPSNPAQNEYNNATKVLGQQNGNEK